MKGGIFMRYLTLPKRRRRAAKGLVRHPPRPIGSIQTHKDLARVIPKMGALLEKSPHFAAMALTDPVKALQFVGYTISPEIKQHMRRSVPSLFGSRRAFHRAMHSTRGLPWVKSVRFIPKRKSGGARARVKPRGRGMR
jgi:hypothetical protein